MHEFGRRLRELRQARGLTLTDLADAVGCSIVYVSKIERGTKPPPVPEKIRAWADRLGGGSTFRELSELADISRPSVEIPISGRHPDTARRFAALARELRHVEPKRAANATNRKIDELTRWLRQQNRRATT